MEMKNEEKEVRITSTKTEDDEEKPPSSLLNQIKTEEDKEAESSTSSSAELIKTETEGGYCRGQQPDRNPDPNNNLELNANENDSASSETDCSAWSISAAIPDVNMVLQGGFKSSWICLLLFSIAACAPAKKGHPNAGYYSGGSGYRRVGPGSDGASFGFTSGAGSNVGSPAAQDAGISQMIAGLMGLSPYGSRPLLQFHWSSPQVPLDMVQKRPVYPSSLIIHSNNGYQRARDFRSDSKYTKEMFDNIPQPGAPQNPDSGSKGH